MSNFDLTADRRQFLAALAATAALPSAAFAAAPGGNHPAIRALIDRYVAEKKVANMVVAVGSRAGPPDFLSAGRLELDAGPPADPDTLYRIHSMTKPITGCAVMMLIEQGKLTLDTPVSAIFPAYADLKVLTDPENSLETRPAARPMLVRHLVTHSAGLAYASNAPPPLARLYAADEFSLWQRPVAGAESRGPANLIAYAESAASLPLLFDPGTRFTYSIALDVAGAIVEKLSGVPFETFLAERIFAPLDMKDTSFTIPAAKLGRLAANYQNTPQGIERIDPAQDSGYLIAPPAPSGGGGLISSARDYARFMAMLLGEGQLGGTRILKTETARLMMSNLMEPGVTATTEIGDSGYGAGGRSVIEGAPGGEAVGTCGWSGPSSIG